MTGYTVTRKPDGIRIFQEGKEIFLDKVEAGMLAETVKEARRHYWKRFRLPVMKEQIHDEQ